MKIDTLAIHAAEDKTAGSGNNATGSRGAVVAPIHLSTTYERDEEGNFSSGYMYTRHGNPNRGALERCLAALEGGEEAACFASGSAAAMAVFQALQPGDHVIVPKDMYMGIQHMIRQVLTRWQLDFSFVNMERLEDYLRPATRTIWMETPSNPMMKVTSIPRIVELARRRNIITVNRKSVG